MNTSTFCTCENTDCPLHPTRHEKGCSPCIAKNLKLREIPNCFFQQIKNSGQITPERGAQAYHMTPEPICQFVFYDTALGFKITFDRAISSGTVGDRDVYGAQQHAPLGLMEIQLP